MFLEAFTELALFVMIVCGGVHCTGWCCHFHGARRARSDHEDNKKWSAIESHFLSRFEEMVGNSIPAVEMTTETDKGTQAEMSEDTIIAEREAEDSSAPRAPVTSCDQATQVYTCIKKAKPSCLATAVRDPEEV